jgi:isoleucyl-tRNA synthetase
VRLWVASVDFREDVVGSEKLMQRIAENYKKIRNTFRYILGNLYDFDQKFDSVPFEKLEEIDKYILLRTTDVIEKLEKWYAKFEFHRIYQLVNQFCIVDLSAFYLDVIKDRLYISAPRSPERRSAQTSLWHIGEALARMLAPILSFTCDEVWQSLPQQAERPVSVHLALFPAGPDFLGSTGTVRSSLSKDDPFASGVDPDSFRSEWQSLRSIRENVMEQLEFSRAGKVIGGGLEAKLRIAASEPAYSLLSKHQDQLRYLFIVSQVVLERAGTGNRNNPGLTINVDPTDGVKCERCWNYSTRVGEDPKYPTLCERCTPVVKEIEASAAPVSSNF